MKSYIPFVQMNRSAVAAYLAGDMSIGVEQVELISLMQFARRLTKKAAIDAGRQLLANARVPSNYILSAKRA